MIYVAIFFVFVVLSVAGRLLYQWQERQILNENPRLVPARAAKDLLRKYDLWPAVAITEDKACSYHHYGRVVTLSPRITERRDWIAVCVAAHEAAHAVQGKRYPWALWFTGMTYPLTAWLFVLAFFPSIREGTTWLPFAIGAIILARAGVEAGAWVIAHRALQSWGYPGVHQRLAIASVLSYL